MDFLGDIESGDIESGDIEWGLLTYTRADDDEFEEAVVRGLKREVAIHVHLARQSLLRARVRLVIALGYLDSISDLSQREREELAAFIRASAEQVQKVRMANEVPTLVDWWREGEVT
jgi:hypothetical protein